MIPPMSGQPSRQRPESVQTPVPTTVPIAEAAARLGISVDAVRKRIQRGKLTGQKTDNGWTVVWIEPDIRPDNVQTPVPESSALEALERIPQLPAGNIQHVNMPAPPSTIVERAGPVAPLRDWRWWPFDGQSWGRRKL